ncbi:TnsA endonuclease N-terminal domain-containing protein [Rhodoferax sp. BLA1]|uniref:TnsA endonuclease N-terminal domain-containing protein n=1 Tax=Rhodoferax sp. BLA1 TaxID=2576062 RepID=UPI0015D2739E|nr:TnsA endonuclease N-terminal domain-containing protein [Rhodoferax sp. BLA1]
MPAARKVVTRSPKRNVGLINCPWFQDRPIEHESRLEKHFVLRAILFPGLTFIQHQPFHMTLVEHGKRYTPDFLLTFSNGEKVVIEVKRAERVKEAKDRFDEISRLCQVAGFRYFVVHQGQIEGQRRAERALLIRRYAMHHLDPALVREAVAHVSQRNKGISIKRFKKDLCLSQEQLLSFVAHRHVVLSKDLLISDDDLLFAPNLEIKNASVQFGSWFGCAAWVPTAGVSQVVGGQQGSVSRPADPLCADHEIVDLLRGGDV